MLSRFLKLCKVKKNSDVVGDLLSCFFDQKVASFLVTETDRTRRVVAMEETNFGFLKLIKIKLILRTYSQWS